MPNTLGLYTLFELREKVRRIIDGLQPIVNTTTGEEKKVLDATGNPVVDDVTTTTQLDGALIDPLFTNDDLNFFINSALTETWIDVVVASDTVMADEELIDVKMNIVEYALPDDMAQLRSLHWKSFDRTLSVVPPSKRRLMHQIDEPTSDIDIFHDGAPSYRRNLNFIRLNHTPHHDNPGGILCRYIKHANFLDRDGAFIETQFARVMQEVVIRAAAIEAATTKSQLDVSPLKAKLDEWTTRLSMLVRNSNNPPYVYMTIPEHPIRAVEQRRHTIRISG